MAAEENKDFATEATDTSDADMVLAAVEGLAKQNAEIERLRAELNSTKEQLMRKAADFQNYRRRTEQERASYAEIGKATVLRPMLGVLDDLKRSLDAAGQGDAQVLAEGVELVYRKFLDELKRLNVEPIPAVGAPFDEHLHEAVMQQPATEATPSGTVIQDVQTGYQLGDRVLRHSKVIVSI